jgi:hypothetical protein
VFEIKVGIFCNMSNSGGGGQEAEVSNGCGVLDGGEGRGGTFVSDSGEV